MADLHLLHLLAVGVLLPEQISDLAYLALVGVHQACLQDATIMWA